MVLRYILLIIGVLIILGIAFDGWRRKRRRLQMSARESIEPKIPTPTAKRTAENIETATAEEVQETIQPVAEDISDAVVEQPQEEEQVATVSHASSAALGVSQTKRDPHNVEIETVSAPTPANERVTLETTPRPETVFSANEAIPETKPKIQEPKITTETADVITLTVMSINSRPFAGYDLIQALEENHLHYGEFGIYHRHKYKNGKGPLYFSVASVVKPGTLDPKSIGTLSTPGLALFMQLNNRKHDRIVFKQILATAHQLAKTLGGVVCDNKRVPLREATLQSYAEKIDL